MPFTFFNDIATQVMDLVGPIESAGLSLLPSIVAIVVAGITLVMVWQGYNLIRGQGENKVFDLITPGMRAILVLGLCLSGTQYVDNIITPIVGDLENPGTEGGIQAAILNQFWGSISASASNPDIFPASAPPTNSFDAIDAAMTQGFSAYEAIESDAFGKFIPSLSVGTPIISLTTSFPFFKINFNLNWDIGEAIIEICSGGILLLTMLILCILGFADLLVNLIGLKIMFGVGPIFIACYAFKATEQYCQTWLKAVLKWTLANILIVIVIDISANVLTYVANNMSSVGSTDISMECLAAIVTVVSLFLVTAKAGMIAADLLGSQNEVGSLTSKISRAAGDAVKGFLKGGVAGAVRESAQGALQGAMGSRMGGSGPGMRFMNGR